MASASFHAPDVVEQRYDLILGDTVQQALTLHQCVAKTLRVGIEKLRYTPERVAAEFGGLLHCFDGDLALNDIAWRCWIAGERFSGDEADVVRMRRHCFAVIMGHLRGREAMDLDAAGRDALERLGARIEASDAEPPHLEPRAAHTGLPAPLHLAAPPGSRVRDGLSQTALRAFETLAAVAAARPGEIPGFETLAVSLDLPVQRAASNADGPGTDRVAHAEGLIAAYVRMSDGEIVTPADEITLALGALPERWRTLALHRLGLATGATEGLDAAAARIGVGGERGRQIMERVTGICERHPLPLPLCTAAWSAFPSGRVAVTLEEWWRALPECLRPARPSEMHALLLPEQWHWFPEAAWVSHEQSFIVALEPLTAAAVEKQLQIAGAVLRAHRSWGAVSLEELTLADIHPDVVRAMLPLEPEWRQASDGWFMFAGDQSFLSRKVARWAASARPVHSAAMRRALLEIVRARRADGKPCSVPPTSVLRALRAVAPRRERAPSNPPSAQPTMPNKEVKTGFDLSGSQAQYLIDRLLRDGRITSSDMATYLGEMTHEIELLEERLRVLRAAYGAGIATPEAKRTNAASIPAAASPPRERPVPRRRHARADMSPETLASRQMQGYYLALMRKIPDERRAEFKRITAEQGRAAAIEALRADLGIAAQDLPRM